MALTQIELGMLKDGILTADTAGRLKMADGFVNSAKMAAGAARANFGAGAVLQVVQGTLSSNFSSSSSTFTAIGATLSITPSSTSSRILLMASVGVGVSASAYIDMTVFRDSTNLAGAFGFITTFSSAATLSACQNFSHIDSPATTSAISYSIRMRTQTGVSYSVINAGGQTCTLIAMEIAG